jgi:phosphonopyruvate decarboxylase
MSTGGQRTITDRVALEEVARSCGYRRAIRVATEDELASALSVYFDQPGPAMLLAVVETGNLEGVGRVETPPDEIAARFRAAATGEEGR